MKKELKYYLRSMVFNSKMLEGKIAIITGCGSGIGKAILELFLDNGAVVYAVDRDHDSLLKYKDAPFCKPVVMDVANVEHVKTLFIQIKKEQNRLDILVNNAGIMRDALIGMISKEQVESTYSVNVFAVIEMLQYASKFFKRQQSGVVINLASIMGVSGDAGKVLYSSSKGAVISLTKAAAKELAPLNIRVNAIAPGTVDTALLDGLDKQQIGETIARIGMGRLAQPYEIAQVALFLASDMSQYVTGQIIGVDGSMVV